MPQQYGLGRGLSSLIPQHKVPPATSEKSLISDDIEPFIKRSSMPQGEEQVMLIDLDAIIPNPHQPRKVFSLEKLRELADSIREKGILQPLIVTRKENKYELIAGERRLRAAKIAGLSRVPALVRKYENLEKLEWAIIENVQRHDLNVLEEARAYRKLAQEFSLSQEAIAKKVGKSRSAVANIMRLLSLPVEIQRSLEEEKITEGHAKALLSIENPEKQRALFERILKDSLTVRQTEEQSKMVMTSVRSHQRAFAQQDPQLKAVEDELRETLGTKVSVKKQGSGARVVIDCYSKDDLVAMLNRIR